MTRISKAIARRSKGIRKNKSKNYNENIEKEEEIAEEKKEEENKPAPMVVDKQQDEIAKTTIPPIQQ